MKLFQQSQHPFTFHLHIQKDHPFPRHFPLALQVHSLKGVSDFLPWPEFLATPSGLQTQTFTFPYEDIQCVKFRYFASSSPHQNSEHDHLFIEKISIEGLLEFENTNF